MSVPNLTNSIIQPQSIVVNQVPLTHTLMNVNNGIPIATALTHAHDQSNANELKTGITVVETIPMANASIVGVQNVPIVQASNSAKSLQNATLASTSSETAQVLTKQRLQDLIRDTDSTLTLEEEIEEIILNYVDEFVDRCLSGAALIAKNRNVNTVEVKDVQQFLNRNYNMWTPGFGTDELKPYKRSSTTEAHKQRLTLIRKSLKKY